jgi:N6-L-threonylcarbamoyladenine synthase
MRLSPRLVDPDLGFPYLLLLVSGGHCQLLEVRGVGDYRRLATTIDDAAGEAFDKAAKLLGLPYPGGPAIEALAREGDAKAVPLAAAAGRLARAAFLLRRPQERGAARGRRGTHRPPTSPPASSRRWSTASSTAPAARWRERRAGAGGRRRSRGQLRDPRGAAELCREQGRGFSVPPGWLCTDNAAMIAWAGAERFAAGPDRRRSTRRPAPLAARRAAEKVRGAGVKA